MKKILSFLIMILLINFINVNADSIVDFNKKGSLTITLMESESSEYISVASIKVTKIASAYLDNNSNIVYEFVDELKNSNIILDDLTKEDLLKDILKYMEENNIELNGDINNTDDLGKVSFNDLDLGLYIISQENIVEGYSSIDSYLLTIPTIIDNEWVYDIDSLPKTELIKLIDISVEKIWKNNRISIPNSVTIELLKDEEVIDSVTLSEENEWKHVFERLPISDSYSVREKDVPKGYKVTYKQDGDYSFTVINTNKLPQTGEYTFIIPILVSLGIILIGIGLYLDKRGNIHE